MKIQKNSLNELIALWIRWDAELWGELREIQIKLLHQRIVKQMSFLEMAEFHGATIGQLRKIFSAILFKIERAYGKRFVSILRQINDELELSETGIQSTKKNYSFGRIYLN